ncbi:MAG: ATP-binding protein [DPANN group archaeon]|nr:ATP-binding protein [DPANN group archaeon]
MNLKNLILYFRLLSDKEKAQINILSKYLDSKTVKLLTRYLKQKRITLNEIKPYSEKIINKTTIKITSQDQDLLKKIGYLNTIIDTNNKKEILKKLSKDPMTLFNNIIAPNIIGFDTIKKATALQLFSKERLHILTLGDPGTGKTDILESIKDFAEIHTFGLGSGTSTTGLTVTFKGNEALKGLLPLANNGIAMIDELNLMKTEDRAGLLNAMENGFVSFDKGGIHQQFDANCSVLATANPKGTKFKGDTTKEISSQIPFDNALLSRFSLVFIVKEYTDKEFTEITKKMLEKKNDAITKNDKDLIKYYIKKSKELEPEFTQKYSDNIKSYILETRKKQENIIIPITPRFVSSIKKLAIASARMNWHHTIEKDDVELAIELSKKAIASTTFKT